MLQPILPQVGFHALTSTWILRKNMFYRLNFCIKIIFLVTILCMWIMESWNFKVHSQICTHTCTCILGRWYHQMRQAFAHGISRVFICNQSVVILPWFLSHYILHCIARIPRSDLQLHWWRPLPVTVSDLPCGVWACALSHCYARSCININIHHFRFLVYSGLAQARPELCIPLYFCFESALELQPLPCTRVESMSAPMT